jgi:hypothetical protein
MKRVYYLYILVPANRGGHAHMIKTSFIAISGSFDVIVKMV